MSKRRNTNYRNPNRLEVPEGWQWFNHYYNYLKLLSLQLFEWKGLPDSIDPRYLETRLQSFGYVGFYRDKNLGYLLLEGAHTGILNVYGNPTDFIVSNPVYQKQFKLYNYSDPLPSEKNRDKYGVLLYNNDFRTSTNNSLRLFAQELAQLKEIISVNVNAQKTPVLIIGTDETKLSVQNMYNQYEGNAPAIFIDKQLDVDALKVLRTDAPYVTDKLNVQKNAVWNEIMTFLSIENANQDKKTRMLVDEVNGNNQQVSASGNVFLKTRREFCEMVNRLYPDLNISVELSAKGIEMLEQAKEKEVGEN